MMKSTVIALAALSIAAPAFARENVVTRHVDVEYSDLNLNSEAGRETLKERIELAVVAACGPRAGRPFNEVVQCRREARADVYARSTGEVRAALTPMMDAHRIATLSR